jgi:hypothetical protein
MNSVMLFLRPSGSPAMLALNSGVWERMCSMDRQDTSEVEVERAVRYEEMPGRCGSRDVRTSGEMVEDVIAVGWLWKILDCGGSAV